MAAPSHPPVLVTGAAGFIGFHTCRRLLAQGLSVIGLDNFTAYYAPALKEARAAELAKDPGFTLVRGDIATPGTVLDLVRSNGVARIVHLAAQAGVRWSVEHPEAYADSNLTGFVQVLEAARHGAVEHLVYASSSSVYGANTSIPFRVGDDVSHPVSLYAATKLANEAMAFTYSHLYRIPATGLRFFTVYGPWGRPDMAYYKFTDAILAGRAIDVYNQGDLKRDFTYVDDIVEGVLRVLGMPPVPQTPAGTTADAPHRLYNIGNDRPVRLLDFIAALEDAIGIRAHTRMVGMQLGDVPATWADVAPLEADTGYRPSTSLEVGLRRFVAWYREYHGLLAP